jgi:hypothetical protein
MEGEAMAPRKRPNLLLITTDQQRGDCLGCDGHPVLETPYLDQLAAGGLRLRRAYTSVPACTPARAAILTGMDQWHHGRLAMAGADALEVRLAHASGGRVVAKTAAEAVFCATIPERGWGLAFKMEDGGGRTVQSMAAALLALVGPAEDEARDQLMGLARHGIHTADGREAGEMAPVFQLQRGQVG